MALTYRDIDFLIPHLKHQDIHLYEALQVGNDNVKKTISAVNDIINKPSSATYLREFVFGMGVGGDIIVAAPATGKITVSNPKGTTCLFWTVTGVTAPVGADIVIDFLRNGISVLPSGSANKIILPAAQVRNSGTAFLTSGLILNYKDEVWVNVTQVGSPTPGREIIVQVVTQVNV